MSSRLPTVWAADAHTIAKIAILRSYIEAWLPILATSSKRPILYVDGFAGPGRYTNYESGSPRAALDAISSSLANIGSRRQTSGVTCAFIEADRHRFSTLDQSTTESKYGSVRLRKFNTTFVDGIQKLEREFPGNFSGDDPLFVFADPFGGTDTPLETFISCMKGGRSELLINLDADGIARIFEGKNNRWDTQLDSIFGGRCWETQLGQGNLSLHQKATAILHLYKRRLREVVGVKYLFEFEMRGKNGTLNYYLVFATNHPLGMERMKEAMKKVDQNGSYCFSDADDGQVFMFTEQSSIDYAEYVRHSHEGNVVPYEEIERFCLCETPAASAGSILRLLEKQGYLEVESAAGVSRRKGTFNRDTIISVRFIRKLVQDSLF